MTDLVLGIETSCDETAAAVISSDGYRTEKILSNVIRSQIEHIDYGGVVPEIAARAHSEFLFPIIQKALETANVSLEELSAISATCGPGLIGGVMIGALAGKTIALLKNKPFIPVNHLEGHAQVCGLNNDVAFPYLLLLVSGGHCQFLEVYDIGVYKLLGCTMDDAAGEAFDKVARLLGLPQPGGPSIEQAALKGNANRFSFAIPMKGREGCCLSFSGLKTAFRVLIQRIAPLSEQDVNDVAACLQKSISDEIVDRAEHAIAMASEAIKESKTFVLAGGVAANKAIQNDLKQLCDRVGFNMVTPSSNLCTDNAVMIGWVGLQRYQRGEKGNLFFAPTPNWSLLDLIPAEDTR